MFHTYCKAFTVSTVRGCNEHNNVMLLSHTCKPFPVLWPSLANMCLTTTIQFLKKMQSNVQRPGRINHMYSYNRCDADLSIIQQPMPGQVLHNIFTRLTSIIQAAALFIMLMSVWLSCEQKAAITPPPHPRRCARAQRGMCHYRFQSAYHHRRTLLYCASSSPSTSHYE